MYKDSDPGVVSVVYITAFMITTFSRQLSWFLLQHAAVADHTLSLSAVALSMHTCQPWASAERWGGGLRTLSRTTQDGCFPSCSSISRPMIHFTDTWVIIGVCSSPLGMKLHERSQGGEWGWVVVGGGGEDRVRSEWVKTKRQEWRGWRWSRRCSEMNVIHLTGVNGLVQKKQYFQWLNEAN